MCVDTMLLAPLDQRHIAIRQAEGVSGAADVRAEALEVLVIDDTWQKPHGMWGRPLRQMFNRLACGSESRTPIWRKHGHKDRNTLCAHVLRHRLAALHSPGLCSKPIKLMVLSFPPIHTSVASTAGGRLRRWSSRRRLRRSACSRFGSAATPSRTIPTRWRRTRSASCGQRSSMGPAHAPLISRRSVLGGP